MATTLPSTEPPPLPEELGLSCYDTALCIVPPTHLCGKIDSLRVLHDKAHGRWPAHLTILHPFVPVDNLPRARGLIEKHLAHLPRGTPEVSLGNAGHFAHRKNSVVWIGPTDEATRSFFDALRGNALNALGHSPSSCAFHLTIGQSEGRNQVIERRSAEQGKAVASASIHSKYAGYFGAPAPFRATSISKLYEALGHHFSAEPRRRPIPTCGRGLAPPRWLSEGRSSKKQPWGACNCDHSAHRLESSGTGGGVLVRPSQRSLGTAALRKEGRRDFVHFVDRCKLQCARRFSL